MRENVHSIENERPAFRPAIAVLTLLLTIGLSLPLLTQAQDTIPPTALCQDVTLFLDGSGNAVLDPFSLDNGSFDPAPASGYTNGWTGGVVSVDNCGSYCSALPSFTITEGVDIPSNAFITDVNVSITWTKTNGSCASPSPGNPGNAETSFRLDGPTGNVILASPGTWSGSTAIDTVVTDFDQGAGVPSGTPVSGTFGPNGGDLSTLNGQAPYGTWTISAGDNTNNRPLCVFAYSISISYLSFSADLDSVDCGDIGVNAVTLTVADSSGNISTCAANVTVMDTIPPSAICQDITVALDSSGTASITVADIDNGSSDDCGLDTSIIDITAFTCADTGVNTVQLTVTDFSGNTDSCTATVTVVDNIAPVAICQDITVQPDSTGSITVLPSSVDNGSSDGCGIDSIWLDASTFTCSELGDTIVTLSVWDNNGNMSSCSATISVEDNTPPVLSSCPPDVTLNNIPATCFQNIFYTMPTASDNCGVASVTTTTPSGSILPVGVTPITIVATDVNGLTDTCIFTVTVLDVQDPILANCPGDTVISNDPAVCNAAFDWFPPTASDNCPGVSVVASHLPPVTFNVGVNTVTYVATDASGNVDSCSFTVTVQDTEDPVAACADTTLYLDASGSASVTAAELDGGSTDNCAVTMISIDQSAFNCGDVGANTVTLTATDMAGNTGMCTSNVTVLDTIAPVALCMDITVEPGSGGTVTIGPGSVNAGSSDACGISTLTLDAVTFDCDELGDTTVTLTVTDVNGNASTCTAVVTVEDTTPPSVTCQDITVALDSTGNVTISANDVNASTGGLEPNGVVNILTDDFPAETAFTLTSAGGDTLIFSPYGGLLPGNTLFTIPFVLDCDSAYTFTIYDSFGDGICCGFGAGAYSVVIGSDTVVMGGAFGFSESTAISCGSAENCAIDTTTIDISMFDCSDVGDNTVTLTVTDVNGNSGMCTATVTVEDVTPPVAVCQDVTVYTDGSGNAAVVAADLDGGSTDACGVDSYSASPMAFTCDELGSNPVTLTVFDVNGNSATCIANVEVMDSIAPMITCPSDIVVSNDPGVCEAAVTVPTPIVTDNCGNDSLNLLMLLANSAPGSGISDTNTPFGWTIDSIVVSGAPDSAVIFDVTLDVDISHTWIGDLEIALVPPSAPTYNVMMSRPGSPAVGSGCMDDNMLVTFDDNAAYTAMDLENHCNGTDPWYMGSAQPVAGMAATFGGDTINGTWYIIVADFAGGDDGTLNSWGLNFTYIDPNGRVGQYSVSHDTKTLYGGAGDLSERESTSMEDKALAATGANERGIITLYNDYNGTGDASDVYPVGTTTVTWVASDESGNVDSCTMTVTVNDTEAPMTVCQDITVQLDATGNASIVAADVDGGTTDNCALDSLSIDIADFTCADVGTNGVTLTAVDSSGNSSSCMANVEVEDNVPPTAVCQDVTVYVDSAGSATIMAGDVDGGSTDACGIAMLAVDTSSFDCDDAGSNTVTLTVTDVNGNSATCMAMVTVADSLNPTIICPADITATTDPGVCEAFVLVPPPDVMDNCGPGADTSEVGTSTPAGAIVDNGPPFCDTISITGTGGSVSGVTVDVSLTHTWIGDLDITLTSPDGTTVSLMDRPGFPASTFGCNNTATAINLTFDAMAAVTAAILEDTCDDAFWAAGTAQPVDPFFTLNGDAVDGTWILCVTDNEGGDVGTLDSWTISVDYPSGSRLGNVERTSNLTERRPAIDLTAWASRDEMDKADGIEPSAQRGIVSLWNDYTGTDDASAVYPIGTTVVTWVATDESGNTDTCTHTVTVEDMEAPTVVCEDITVYLDASGMVSISADDVSADPPGATAMGNVNILTDDFPGETGFALFDAAGDTIISVEVGDLTLANNPYSFPFTIDCGPPSSFLIVDAFGDGICCGFGAGEYTVDVNGVTVAQGGAFGASETVPVACGTMDNCGLDSLSIDISGFDCSNLGDNSVMLTAVDLSGNSATCTATVTVVDTIPPVAVCMDATVFLDASGNVTVLPGDVDGGSADACAVDSAYVTPSTLTCADLGTNTVTLTVVDSSGNMTSCMASVEVLDTLAPVILCPMDVVQGNDPGLCEANVSVPQPTAMDNCDTTAGGVLTYVNDYTGTEDASGVYPVGSTTVEWVVTDEAGNSDTCTMTVTVNDTEAPMVICQDITVQLDAMGMTGITAADVDAGTTDNCALDSLSIDISSFDCSDVGDNTVTLTAVDSSGNSSNCMATVTVEDNVPPMAMCQDVTVYLDGSGNATVDAADVDNGSTDACGVDTLTVDPSVFDCGNAGPNAVTLTVTDVNGNTATCMASVEVLDTLPPMIVCPMDVVQGNDPGVCEATVSVPQPTVMDNCDTSAMGTLTLVNDFNGTDDASGVYPVGTTTVEWIVTDVGGNTDTCTMTVTVNDTEAPVAVCMNITVELDSSGMASITAADIDGGTMDNCMLDSIWINPVDGMFNCASVGPNNVTLNAVDTAGNMSSCVAVVTVEDNIAPEALCQDVTVYLDGSGNASIDAADVDNGSNDACGIDTITLDLTMLDCSDAPVTTVTLTVTDVNGNSAACMATVEVMDTIAPVITCPADIVQNNDSTVCISFITVPQPTATDNCPGTLTYINDFNGTDDASGVYPLGTTVVTWTVTDVGGNTDSCTMTVTVIDTEDPDPGCPADTMVLANIFECSAQVFWTFNPTDNCAIDTVFSNYQPGDIFPIGTTTVTATAVDEFGNTGTCSFDITVYTDLEIIIDSVVDVSCFNGEDGAIYTTIVGGVPPYTIRWSNNLHTEDIDGLEPGGYVLYVEDAIGCSAITPIIEIDEPGPIFESAPAVIVDAGCVAGTGGSIDVSISGGTPPFMYSWSNGATTEDLADIEAGTYQVTVTDANGCVFLSPFYIVDEPAVPLAIIQALIADAECNGGSEGGVDITVTGGTPPYTFLWSDGSMSEDLAGVAAGDYFVTITDDNGCVLVSDDYTVGEPTAIMITNTIVEDADCFGAATGTIKITVTGGTPPYDYLWSNGAMAEDIGGLAAGDYSVDITDANGCVFSFGPFTVGEPTQVMISSTVITDADCFGASTGAIDITVTGGTPPYQYAWSNGVSSEDQSGIPAGDYTVTVTDANGCIITSPVITVGEPTEVAIISAIIVDNLCSGGMTGSIDIEVGGGVPPYSYLWSNGAMTQDITNLETGDYSVVITDDNGCVLESATLTVGETGGIMQDTVIVVDPTCEDTMDAMIDITIVGGTPPYTIVWSTGDTVEDLTGIAAGDYTYTVTDVNGCFYESDVITLENPSGLDVVVIVKDASCLDDESGVIQLEVSGGTPPYSFLWNTGATSQDLVDIPAGIYSVTVSDANGCTFQSGDIEVTQPDTELTGTIEATPESFLGAQDGAVDIEVMGGDMPYTYIWNTGDSTQDISNVAAGEFCVRVIDANGCVLRLCAEVGIGTAVTDIFEFGDIDLYPNPTMTIANLYVSFSRPADLHVELVDVLGRVLQSEAVLDAIEHQITYDMREMPSGTYFIRLNAEGAIRVLPLVVQH